MNTAMGNVVEWHRAATALGGRMNSGSNSALLGSVLAINQIVNASFPTGSFSHSYGLETLIAQGEVADGPALEKACRAWLRYSVCTADGIAVAQAHSAAREEDLPRLLDIDRRISVMRLTRETRAASALTGRALLNAALVALDAPLLRSLSFREDPPAEEVQHPVVFGAVLALAGAAEDEAVALFLLSSFSSLLAVGARLLPLGQAQVQGIIAGCRDLFVDCARISQERSLDQMSAAATHIEIASMQHERQPSRLCMS